MQLKELKDRVKRLEEKIVELAMYSHEPKNYREKCDEMEKRIEALEKKTTMFR
jgi:BMFP domain-containing protein YqiC